MGACAVILSCRPRKWYTTPPKASKQWSIQKKRVFMVLPIYTVIELRCSELYCRYLAIGHYKNKHYDKAEHYNNNLIQLEPNNAQVRPFQSYNYAWVLIAWRLKIWDKYFATGCSEVRTCCLYLIILPWKLTQCIDAAVGMAVVGGAVALAGVALGALLRKRWEWQQKNSSEASQPHIKAARLMPNPSGT